MSSFFQMTASGVCCALVLSITLFQPTTAEEFTSGSPEALDSLDTVYSDITPAYSTTPSYSAASVTVITADQFQARDISVADVIERAPSVQVQDSGEQGSYQNVTVRGAPSEQTQVYIDGVLQSKVGGSRGYLSQIPLADTERIEVYPSNLPLSFGQTAPGGAINIVRKQANQTAGKLALEAGSFGHQRAALSGQWRKNRWQASGFIEGLQTDNDFSYNNDNGTPDYLGDDETQTRNNAQYEAASGSLALGYNADTWSAKARFDAQQTQKNLPHWNNLDITDTQYNQYNLAIGAEFNRNGWLNGLDSSLRWQWAEQAGHFVDPNGNISLAGNDSYDTLNNQQWLHYSALVVPFGLVSINNEYQHNEYELRDVFNGTSLNAERQQLNNALGVEWFIGDAMMLNAAINHLWYEDERANNRQTEDEWGARAGLRAEQGAFVLTANVQQASRQPSLLERFGRNGSFQGNSELASETAKSADIGLTFTGQAFTLTTTGFVRHSENTIAATYNSQGIGRYENLAESYFWGVEWQGAYTQGDWQLASSGTWQQSITYSPLRAYDNTQVPGYYPISLSTGLTWQAPLGVVAELDYRYEDGLYFDRANSTLAPTKHQIDVEIRKVWKNTRTALSVENLLDENHTDVSRKPLPGIRYVLSIELNLGNNHEL